MEIIFKIFAQLVFGTLTEVTPFWVLPALIGFGLLCFAIYGIWNADKYSDLEIKKKDHHV